MEDKNEGGGKGRRTWRKEKVLEAGNGTRFITTFGFCLWVTDMMASDNKSKRVQPGRPPGGGLAVAVRWVRFKLSGDVASHLAA